MILRPAEQAVIGIETFDLRPPIDPETSERMAPVPPADPEGERNAILEEVRAKFDRTLKSDYRSLNDMLDWPAPLLTTTEFRRTVSLVAEAIATRPAQSRSTNIIRLAYNNPNLAWRQPAPSVPWDPAAAAPAPTPAQATVLRTGEVGLFATFVKLIQGRSPALTIRSA
ncbi:hypothetical protein CBM2589_U10158 [Cupriavidus taiwanensis]|uniref:Uncharacterized protein n=1 Tax=Cupriavidus taiwanensis TaxID=164546 RepID=A0A375CQH9_9BURK|nr:hypothetical protein [Cupriavidus taiwanensis]SOY77656.1 hypothetical protein CBM2589_U10158 [Cupriavidus taiwanensis]